MRLPNQWKGSVCYIYRAHFATLLFSAALLGSPLFRLGLQVGKRISGHDGAQRVRSLIVVRCPDVCYVLLFFLSMGARGRGANTRKNSTSTHQRSSHSRAEKIETSRVVSTAYRREYVGGTCTQMQDTGADGLPRKGGILSL